MPEFEIIVRGKVERFISDYDTLEVLERLGDCTGDFAAELYARYRKSVQLSDKQVAWAHYLVFCMENPESKPSVEPLGNWASIEALFKRAGLKLKTPRIHFDVGGQPVVLHLAGPKSRYPGCIQVTDGGEYGNNKWFGRITAVGLTVSRNMTEAVLAFLKHFAAEPATVASEYGKRTGRCCFCNRCLDTPESTVAGYGPTCAENFGLPWGRRKGRVRV